MNQRTMYAKEIERIRNKCTIASLEQRSLTATIGLRNVLMETAAKCQVAQLAVVSQNGLSDAQFQIECTAYAEIRENAEWAENRISEHIEKLTPVPAAAALAEPASVRVEIKASDLQASQPTWGKFDGNLFHWQSFRDRFAAGVHNNEHIKPVFKLQQLLSALTGRASNLVGTRQPTEAGYQSAWERLNEVYNNQYMIVRAILKTMFSMPSLERATHDGLRKLVDTMHEAVRQLRAQEIPVDTWDQILVFMMVERLDKKTADEWDMTRGAALPTLLEICAFLDKRVQNMTNAPLESEPQNHASMKRKNHHEKPVQGSSRSLTVKTESGTASKAAAGGDKTPKPCKNCQGDHPLYRCPDLLALNIAGRKEAIRRMEVCPNCLRQHAVGKCLFGPCGRCKPERHNSILCPQHSSSVNSTAAVRTAGPQAKRRRKQKEQNTSTE